MERKICLNGLWDFSGNSTQVSVLPEIWEEKKIKVPSPYNVNSFAGPRNRSISGDTYTVCGGDFVLYPEYPEEWGSLTCGFYRRSVFVPRESEGKRLFLRFEGLSYRSAVYVNGRMALEEMEGFLPIEAEITGLVRYGVENEIIVGAQKAKSLIYQDSTGRNRLDHPIGSFWGEHIGGIWQDVWLIERPETFVSDLFAVTDTACRTLTVRYELDGTAEEGAGRVDAVLIDERGSERVIVQDAPALRCGTLRWDYEEGEIRLWETESPALYTLALRLKREGRILAETVRRIGFRTFTAGKDCFYLNGRPIKLVADAWHYMGYSVQTPEYARSYYRMAREAGVNIIRLHAQPWPEFFYDIADEMGMLIVCESAVWASHCNFSYSALFFENSKRHLRRLIRRDRNHPSIVMWSPENECIPAYHVCGSQFISSVEELEDKIYGLISEIPKLDPSRLISCDGSGDLKGRLPVNSIHYPGYDCPVSRDKPVTIGEMGSMYYSTPDTLCLEHGELPLKNMEERLKAVAADAWYNLMGERRWAAQICVFNLIWYGLQPYPFRERLLEYEDEDGPGIRPSRITPYLRTLNAGMEPGAPEFYPNPVYEMAKKAYAPVRFYLEGMPATLWKGESLSGRLYLFHDRREAGAYRLEAVWKDGGGERTLLKEEPVLQPCSVSAFELSAAGVCPAGTGRLEIVLWEQSTRKIVWQENRKTEVYDRDDFLPLAERFRKTAVFCTEGGEERELPALFRAGEEIRFREPVACHTLPYERYRGGRALYFDGEGNAVIALARRDAKEIVSGIDLESVPGTEGIRLAASLMAELAADGRTEDAACGAAPSDGYARQRGSAVLLCEDEEGGLEKCLRIMGCRFRRVTEEELGDGTAPAASSLLILGHGKTHLQDSGKAGAFPRVLIAAGEAGETGLSEVPVERKKIYHFSAADGIKKELGIYGLQLYGLERDREQVLTESVMTDREGKLEKLIFLPEIDWRMWNNDPEEIKTVSAYRSGLEDRSAFCVLGRRQGSSRTLYYSTLGTDPDSAKQRELWERLLAALGAVFEEPAGAACPGERNGEASDADVPAYMKEVLQ